MEDKLKYRIINALRQVSRWVPAKAEAKKRAMVRVQIGTTKKGKPKYRRFFKCAKCLGLFNSDEVHADHYSPAIDPVRGFQGWNEYIDRLFCSTDGYQILCVADHKAKSLEENQIRKLHRKPRKKKKKSKTV